MKNIITGVMTAIETSMAMFWLLLAFASFAFFAGIPILLIAWAFGMPAVLPWFLIPIWLGSVLTLGHSVNKLA